MARYLYILSASKKLNEVDLSALKTELCTVFQTQEVMMTKPQDFKVVSPLDPDQVSDALRRLTGKYGPVEIRTGAKLD